MNTRQVPLTMLHETYLARYAAAFDALSDADKALHTRCGVMLSAIDDLLARDASGDEITLSILFSIRDQLLVMRPEVDPWKGWENE